MKNAKRWMVAGAGVVLVTALVVAPFVYRAVRVVRTARGFESQVRYLIENGGTIGESPASETFSTDYLKAVFGENPELLEQLTGVIGQGLAEEPALNLGEVAAMVISYHKDKDGKAKEVVVMAVGGFALAKEKPGFHRHGYFFQQLDPKLWNMGNLIVGGLGRDVVLFSSDEKLSDKRRQLIDSLFTGDIGLLLEDLADPYYFTIVFPDPRRVFPPDLRSHVQAVIVKGHLGRNDGSYEITLLTPSEKAATYALSVMRDLKIAAEVALKTRWKGTVQQTEWGPVVDPWWAYEIVGTLEQAKLDKDQSLVRMQSVFGRVMVNVVLKGVERCSRDLAQMRGSLAQREDPRQVDAALETKKPLHYWSESHRWGPDWPIAPTNAPEQAPAPQPAAADAAAAQPQPAPATTTP